MWPFKKKRIPLMVINEDNAPIYKEHFLGHEIERVAIVKTDGYRLHIGGMRDSVGVTLAKNKIYSIEIHT